jgi:hypothetical protein
MFNLDQAISEWRRRLSAAGMTSSDVLDELESHLREDLEQRMRSGATAEQSFREAVQRVGTAENLNVEFAKVRRPSARLSHNTMRVCCLSAAAYVFVVETWTLLVYDISIRGRIFGIGVVVLIAGFIGFLPELKRLLWPGARGRAVAKAIYTICSYVSVAWVCLLFLGEGHIGILSLKMVADVVCWGLVALAVMTVFVFAWGADPEAPDVWAPAVWQSFELAGAEAARLHHDFIGTEHVLLGLLGDENGKVRRVLENLGVRREMVRAEIETIVGTGPQSQTNRPPVYTPRARKAFRFAIREAKAARVVRAEPEHVFLGLLKEGGGVAAKVLNSLGVDTKKAREQLQSAEGPNDHA